MIWGTDSAYTCERLQEHESKTNGHAITHALLEQLLELSLLAHAVCTALLDLSADLTHLVLNVCVRRIEIAKLRQDLLSSFEVVTTSQPTWRPMPGQYLLHIHMNGEIRTRDTKQRPKEAEDRESAEQQGEQSTELASQHQWSDHRHS